MTSSFNRFRTGEAPLTRMPMPGPVSAYQYREIPAMPRSGGGITVARERREAESAPRAEVELSKAELESRLAAARQEGARAAEARLTAQTRAEIDQLAGGVSSALAAFEAEQRAYFGRVEGEVVRLALSVAGKILHREAQVDPLLVAALVQIALNQLRENTAVTVRVPTGDGARWRDHFAARPQSATVTVTEDGELEPGSCVLETELGRANFSLAAQLKEVEQGFFDLLSQSPRP